MKLKNLSVDYASGIVWSSVWLHDSQCALLSSVCWLHPQTAAKHFATCFLLHIQEDREVFFPPKLWKTNNLSFNWTDLGCMLACEERVSLCGWRNTIVLYSARIDLYPAACSSLNQIWTRPWSLEGYCIRAGKIKAIADTFQMFSGLLQWTFILSHVID